MHSSDYLIAFPLILAIISLWFSNRVWITLLALAGITGLCQGKITVWSLLFLGAGFGLALLIAKFKTKEPACSLSMRTVFSARTIVAILLHASLIVWIVGLFIWGLPDYENTLLLDRVYASVDGIPFTLYANLDKTTVVFVLFIAAPCLLKNGSPIKKQRWQNWLLLALGFLAIQVLACLSGLVRPDYKIPPWWWLFALNNLLIICIAEEVMFRGYLQQGMIKIFGTSTGLVIASALFGIAHYQGGGVYMILAGLAGLGYGLAFYMSRRLWVSILTHFLFNLAHLFFYTYPMLKTS